MCVYAQSNRPTRKTLIYWWSTNSVKRWLLSVVVPEPFVRAVSWVIDHLDHGDKRSFLVSNKVFVSVDPEF